MDKFKVFSGGLPLAFLALMVVLFGVVFPHSLSDHYHLLHFAAHFGMSFLFANSIYQFFTRGKLMKSHLSFFLVGLIVIMAGAIYKIAEIYWFNGLSYMPFFLALRVSGFMVSMSQNFSGILAAFLTIIYFDRLIRVNGMVSTM